MLGLSKEIVALCSHDSHWQRLFLEEKKRITLALGDLITDIQHFGSTAITGIDSKPIIDIAVSVKNLKTIKKCQFLLGEIGYEYQGKTVKDGSFFFTKSNPTTHHVHITEQDSRIMKQWLLFRDKLRGNQKFQQEYVTLKRQLAEKFPDDRKSYGQGKDQFIERILSDFPL